jgi:hypothetical protein
MWSKIQDLPRYHNDQKRFQLAIDAQEDAVLRAEGEQLVKDLVESVVAFDNVMNYLVTDGDRKTRADHATAQEQVRACKEKIENWVLRYAPNVHVEEISAQ